MTTDYPSGYRRSRRELEYDEWLDDLCEDAEARGLTVQIGRGHVEILNEHDEVVDTYDFESCLDHPARVRA